MQVFANNLGFSLGVCLLHWPIAFSAVKSSLRLQYRWQPFLVGYALSVSGLAILITLWGEVTRTDPTSGAMGFSELIFLIPIPLLVAVVVTLLLKGRFAPDRKRSETSGEGVSSASTTPTRPTGSDPRRLYGPLTWCSILVGAAVILSLSFPTWELPDQGHHRLGRGFLVGPTDSSLERAEYQCTNVLYDAERTYARLKTSLAADEERWQKDQRDWQIMLNEREEAIRRIRSQGRDPGRVSIDGRDLVSDRNGLPSEPAATAEPIRGWDEQPRDILADAATKVSDARESCRKAMAADRSSAQIDFANLMYQTVLLSTIGGFLCFSVWLVHRHKR
jgi:hypothetical protein